MWHLTTDNVINQSVAKDRGRMSAVADAVSVLRRGASLARHLLCLTMFLQNNLRKQQKKKKMMKTQQLLGKR